MTSSEAIVAGHRSRWWPSRWPLRAQLLGGLIVVFAVVSTVIGAVSLSSLEAFQLARVDEQLTAANNRSQDSVDRPGGFPQPEQPEQPEQPGLPEDFVIRPGQAEGTLSAIVIDGEVAVAGTVAANGDAVALSAEQELLLDGLTADGDPVTVDLGGTLGQYRVVLVEDPNREVVFISGLPLAELAATQLQLLTVIALVTLLGIAVAAVAGLVIVRLALRPLDRVAAAATEVAGLPLDRGDVALATRVSERDSTPDTEVGRVGSALNRMLGHVGAALSARQESEQRLRRFVADASHELRTPLASIRGYAELTRRGDYELPEDAAYALGRVESEAIRMTSLVEDLLLLARLDAEQELRLSPVDLVPLVADAVRDAHAAGQDHRWSLELAPSLADGAPLRVRGDGARLHQVVANILGNARVHTPDGTEVTVSLAEEDASAVLRIVDTGPGIPAELQADLFQRFVRGDSSRSRAAGSTGLGLAIVEAVVHAHGGAVSVSSEPGRTEFRIELPLAPAAEG